MPKTSDKRSIPLKPLKWYKKLARKKERLESGLFLIEGERAVNQIIKNRPDRVTEIVTSEKSSPFANDFPVRFVDESRFHSICLTKTPQGTAAVIRLPLETYSDNLPETVGTKVLLLEDIQDPGNLGTLIRTASAFDFSGIILTEKCADPFSPKCVQSTAGSILSLWIRRTGKYQKLASTLKKRGYLFAAADLDGEADLSFLGSHEKILLALGNEASGLSKTLLNASDRRIIIPISRKKAESLNVATCGAILMYLVSQKP